MIINIDGMNINYIVEGEGNPVVVLHGWGANIETVMPIVNILKSSYQVYAIDLPGFGKSDEPYDVFGSFEYAEIIKKFIDHFKLEKISLIGHSFGGKLSIIISSKYKDYVDKLVLIDSAGLIPKRTLSYHIKVKSYKLAKKLYKLFFFWKKENEIAEIINKKFGSDDYRNSSGIMRKILVKVVNEDLSYLLEEIECPTLLIWGDLDDATPLYQAKIMEEKIKNSGLVVLEGTGHFSYVEDYNKFALVLKSFFNIKQ
ncbi:MAG TPA: alpha/beta hydrolase [Soehngenia sp.]|nr:alpha/beta hydrolase [Soehngenia sp.]